ncbi:GGDEF domain-containing protein [Sulfobacillus thermosulfidooxidans]|uniref:GGDEF domain-containing protein n=1 Tax=Sulfobacillus thermosulfidooxidans TaxID=28034 RepID=UPI0006B4C875|nr:diguanylate cyclase [Sulfobacillus thermosulfidooxidans]
MKTNRALSTKTPIATRKSRTSTGSGDDPIRQFVLDLYSHLQEHREVRNLWNRASEAQKTDLLQVHMHYVRAVIQGSAGKSRIMRARQLALSYERLGFPRWCLSQAAARLTQWLSKQPSTMQSVLEILPSLMDDLSRQYAVLSQWQDQEWKILMDVTTLLERHEASIGLPEVLTLFTQSQTIRGIWLGSWSETENRLSTQHLMGIKDLSLDELRKWLTDLRNQGQWTIGRGIACDKETRACHTRNIPLSPRWWQSAFVLPLHTDSLDTYTICIFFSPIPRYFIQQPQKETWQQLAHKIHLVMTSTRHTPVPGEPTLPAERLYHALLNAVQALFRPRSDLALLQAVCDHLIASGLFLAAWIARPDAAGTFQLVAAAGWGTEQLPHYPVRVDDEEPLIAKVWKHGSIQLHQHHHQLPGNNEWHAFLQTQGWAAGAAVPIDRGKERYAVLSLTTSKPHVFNETVVELIVQIGRLITLSLDAWDNTRKIQQEKQHHQWLAQHDTLTQLFNRSAVYDQLPTLLARASDSNWVGIALLDLDNFKTINDTWGHAAGDAVLQVVGQRLQKSLRSTDLVARWGGDEFLMVLTDIHSYTELHQRLNRFKSTVLSAVQVPPLPSPFLLEGSLGITLYPLDAGHPDVNRLISHADEALYIAKQHKREHRPWWQIHQSASPTTQ